MLSSKGNVILQKIYDQYRGEHVKCYPGCNENDVERAFLSTILDGLDYSSWSQKFTLDYISLEKEINEIR